MSELIHGNTIPTVVGALKEIRAHYQTPLGNDHPQCLIDLAHAVRDSASALPSTHQHRAKLLKAGLLKKTSGTYASLDDGTGVSLDCIAFPTGHAEHYDVLGDAENEASVSWGEGFTYLENNKRYLDVSGYTPRYRIGQEQPGPTPTPKPTPAPSPGPQRPAHPYVDQLSLSKEIGRILDASGSHKDNGEAIAEVVGHLLWRYQFEGASREMLIEDATNRAKG
jgi:hypothetical protein